jgi:DNA polymerase-3 subunit gamma/tau
MRDALSLLDQAIASSEGQVAAECVRQLIGVAASSTLEEVMNAVAQSNSQAILQITDRLLTEGQNPVPFARQLVRFLRNTLVCKVSGMNSSLLQISSDERSRVARIAELFSEEDLARHLQIMLRTHAELGYRQEQRFHLELGLLKMAHAQRLLPLEQLLSGVEPAKSPATDRKATVSPEQRRGEPPAAARSFVSPFAADSARKGTPRMETANEASAPPQRLSPAPMSVPPVVIGAAAPAVAQERMPELANGARAADLEVVRTAAMNALAGAGLNMLSSMLDAGEWALAGSEVVIKVAGSAALIDMYASAEGKRLIIAAASGIFGRPAKLQIIPGAVVDTTTRKPASAPNGSSRGRAEQEPVVRRMMEKFGAEIRTVIDHKRK